MMRLFLLIASVLFIPMVGVAGPDVSLPHKVAPRPVVSEIIGENTAAARGYLGTVTARVEVDLGVPISGIVASRPVKLGDTVKRGDIIAQIDPETLEAAVWAARAGVIVAEQQLNSAQALLEREQTLFERGVESQARLQDAERGHAAAKARLDQARATLARAEDTLEASVLRAPQNGIITATLVEAGAAISAGQPIVRLAGTDARELVVDLSETNLALLPRDAEFSTHLLAVPGTRAKARLRSIDPVADQRTRTRRVHFLLANPPAEFRIGALARILPPPNGGGTMTVQASALMIQPDGLAQVWLVSPKDRVVSLVPVVTGAQLGQRMVIRSGLEPGQEIITKGIYSLKDGQIVGRRVIQ